MAYRIQADAFGDLDRQTAKMLDRLAANEDRGSGVGRNQGGGCVQPVHPFPVQDQGDRNRRWCLKPGALLTREWQGRIERVMALEDGFAWNGKTYASLSAVAFAITGVKWNGHRFFFGPNGRGGGSRSGGKEAAIEQRKVRRDPTSSAEAAP